MNPSYKIGWHCFRALFRFYFGWRVCNPERVPESGPVILACNHASFLDPPLAGAGLKRPISYLARASLFSVPVLAAILRSWEVIAVDRDGGTGGGFKAILERLEGGRAILLFPEGTRTLDGRLQPARSGIGLAVIKSAAPVVPVRVFGTFEAYGKHRSWPRPRQLTVKYGRPMDFAALRAEAQTCAKPRVKQIYQEAAGEIMAAIARLEPKED
jgi:1-acyl-sn-glycerol-3-phosphate acyltransferase